ncbi:MAG: biotin/lipoyl-containing protein [Candidatus Polarisedimenticolia bacterium]
MTGGTLRFCGRVGDRRCQAEISRLRGGRVKAVVDGRSYDLSITEPQARVYSILRDGRSLEAYVEVKPGTARVRLGGMTFDVQTDRGGLPGAGPGGRRADAGGKLTVAAVMPGRVVRVEVTEGQKVTARQGLVVLEAMKMENELASPRDGIVRQVLVQPGRTVETGDPLVVIE